MRTITIQVSDPTSPEGRALLAQLDAYQTSLYPKESCHLLPAELLRQPGVTFLVARVDGQAAGCGALVNQDEGCGEIKRMFVAPQFRGLGLGRGLLKELESLAWESGLSVVRLETGISQPEALSLYEKAGYQRRGPFGEYGEDPLSVFMEKARSNQATVTPPETVTLRTILRPGDLGSIVQLHGTLYAQEYGFDSSFEVYVAGPLVEFLRSRSDRDQLWVAERGQRLVGCIAIVGISEKEAQLRWFLVEPSARGIGLGTRLLREAIEFCRSCGYETVFLRTVSVLTAAARLYQSVGFAKVEERPTQRWGVEVVEEKYALPLG